MGVFFRSLCFVPFRWLHRMLPLRGEYKNLACLIKYHVMEHNERISETSCGPPKISWVAAIGPQTLVWTPAAFYYKYAVGASDGFV